MHGKLTVNCCLLLQELAISFSAIHAWQLALQQERGCIDKVGLFSSLSTKQHMPFASDSLCKGDLALLRAVALCPIVATMPPPS